LTLLVQRPLQYRPPIQSIGPPSFKCRLYLFADPLSYGFMLHLSSISNTLLQIAFLNLIYYLSYHRLAHICRHRPEIGLASLIRLLDYHASCIITCKASLTDSVATQHRLMIILNSFYVLNLKNTRMYMSSDSALNFCSCRARLSSLPKSNCLVTGFDIKYTIRLRVLFRWYINIDCGGAQRHKPAYKVQNHRPIK
jgi:hypothetical protein